MCQAFRRLSPFVVGSSCRSTLPTSTTWFEMVVVARRGMLHCVSALLRSLIDKKNVKFDCIKMRCDMLALANVSCELHVFCSTFSNLEFLFDGILG